MYQELEFAHGTIERHIGLKALVTALLVRVDALKFENVALRTENAELLSRLNPNSKNSHKTTLTRWFD